MGWSLRRSSRRRELERRRLYIEGYSFPRGLPERIRARSETDLSDNDCALVLEGLRTWFVVCLYADGKTLGMPSQAVDVAWHGFTLMAREYEAFCDEAFGHYLQHSSDEPMPAALRQTLFWSERYPGAVGIGGVPLLFALDSELEFAGGSTWSPQQLADLRGRTTADVAGGGYVPAGGEAGYYGGGEGGGDGGGG
jgi:hypothetical protein